MDLETVAGVALIGIGTATLVAVVWRRRRHRVAWTELAKHRAQEPDPHLSRDALMVWLGERIVEHSDGQNPGWCPIAGRYNCDVYRCYGARLDALERQVWQARPR